MTSAYRTFEKISKNLTLLSPSQLKTENISVYVSPGIYKDTLFSLKNLHFKNLTITKYPPTATETVLLNTDNVRTEHSIFEFVNITNATVRGISFTNQLSMGQSISIVDSEKVVVEQCKIENFELGGSIHILKSKNISIRDCLIKNNTALRVDRILGGYFQGNNRSVFQITHSSFGGNIPFFKEGNISSQGGGLEIRQSAYIHIQKCIFSENSARYGGAIFLGDHSSIFIEDSTFIKNRARFQGSVLYATRINSTFRITRSVFLKNIGKEWKCKLIFSDSWAKDKRNIISALLGNITIYVTLVFVSLSTILYYMSLCFLLILQRKDLKTLKEDIKTEFSIETLEKDLTMFQKLEALVWAIFPNPAKTYYLILSGSGISYTKSIKGCFGLIHTILYMGNFIFITFYFWVKNIQVRSFYYDKWDGVSDVLSVGEFYIPFGIIFLSHVSTMVFVKKFKSRLIANSIRHGKIFCRHYFCCFIVYLTVYMSGVGVFGSVLTVTKTTSIWTLQTSLLDIFMYILYGFHCCNSMAIYYSVLWLLSSKMREYLVDHQERLVKSVREGQFLHVEWIKRFSRVKLILHRFEYVGGLLFVPYLLIVVSLLFSIAVDRFGIYGLLPAEVKSFRYIYLVGLVVLIVVILLYYSSVTLISEQHVSFVDRLLAGLDKKTLMELDDQDRVSEFTLDERGAIKIKGSSPDIEKKSGSIDHSMIQLKSSQQNISSKDDLTKELIEYQKYIQVNWYQFSLWGIIPLSIGKVVSVATLLISVFTYIKTVENSISSIIYDFE